MMDSWLVSAVVLVSRSGPAAVRWTCIVSCPLSLPQMLCLRSQKVTHFCERSTTLSGHRKCENAAT